MKLIVLFLLVVIASGCSSDNSVQLKRFVFVDDEGVCHTNPDCPKLKNGKDGYGHSIYAMQPCDTVAFVFNEYDRVCSNCVSVSMFENLKAISDRNKRFNADRHWIYDKLIGANYDMESYEEFVAHLSDKEKRKRLHQSALKEGWDVGSFDEFSNSLGFDNSKQDD